MPPADTQQSHTLSSVARARRLDWPDVARGLSIVGVVLLHVVLIVPDGLDTWLAEANAWLDPLRLPLFFVVSGFFSTKIFNYTLLEVFTKRIWFFLLPYAVWGALDLWTNSLEYHWVFEDPLLERRDLGLAVLLGHNMGWFLHCLILFNLFLWAVRRLPTWLAIALSFSPLLMLTWSGTYFAVGKAVMFLPIFVGGAFLRSYIAAFADHLDSLFVTRRATAASVISYLAALAAYCAGYLVRRQWDLYQGTVEMRWFPGNRFIDYEAAFLIVRLVEQALMLPSAICLVVLLSHVRGFSTFLKFVGRHTLPIYLGHPIALTLCFGFFMARHPLAVTVSGDWPMESTWFWILVCTGYAAIGGVGLWALSTVPVLGWVVTPPPIAGCWAQLWRQLAVAQGSRGSVGSSGSAGPADAIDSGNDAASVAGRHHR